MALETEIRKALGSGDINGLTVWPSEGGWQANVRWKTSLGWTVETRKDPVEALLAALVSRTRYEPKPSDRAAQAVVENNFDDLI